MSTIMGRADIERLCWTLSGWKVDQRSVDELLAAIDGYVTGAGAPWPEGGAGGAVRPADGAEHAPATIDPVEGVSGPQVAAQPLRIVVEVTGTVTTVPAPATRPSRPVKPRASRAATVVPADPKHCTRCKRHRPLTEFSRDSKALDGYRYACKQCESERRRASEAACRERTA